MTEMEERERHHAADAQISSLQVLEDGRSMYESELKAHQQKAAMERAAYTKSFEMDVASLKEEMSTRIAQANQQVQEAQRNQAQEAAQLRQRLQIAEEQHEAQKSEHDSELERLRISTEERVLSVEKALATRGEEEFRAVEERLQSATRAAKEGLAEVREEERRLAEMELEREHVDKDSKMRKEQEGEFLRQLQAERTQHSSVVTGLKNELRGLREEMSNRLAAADKSVQDTKRARLEEVRDLQERLHDMEGRQVKLVAALNRHTGAVAGDPGLGGTLSGSENARTRDAEPLPDEQLPGLREGLATIEQQVEELASAIKQECGVHPGISDAACQQKLLVLKSQLQRQFQLQLQHLLQWLRRSLQPRMRRS